MGIREERLARAATMPHRAGAGEDANDERLESTIGQFFFKGLISAAEFDAGIAYCKIVSDYLHSIDAPLANRGPVVSGPGSRDLSDDSCYQRKILCAQSRQVLKDAADASRTPQTRVITAVDRLAVYGEAPRSAEEMAALRIGLRALAHGSNVIPFRKSN